MLIKRRLKKLSCEFMDNILDGNMKANYIYWIEDNNGKRVSDDFTYNKYIEFGPFIIMEKTSFLSFAILKDKSKDSLYIEGNLYYTQIGNEDLYAIYERSGNGYLVDKKGKILQKNFSIIDLYYGGYIIYQNEYFGFMNSSGVITIKPQFMRVYKEYCFDNDIIGEYPDGTKIHMSLNGEKLSDRIKIEKMYPFDKELLYVEENGLIGLIDKHGSILLPRKFKELRKVTLKPNWLIGKQEDYYGIIDKVGIIIQDFVYSEITEDLERKKLILQKASFINLGM
ncbi:MAG: hypothetical protein E7311_01600 [Clostridiales bacterium]|nr:hypothetical protein [Clostridiales bacterium]